MGSFDWKSLVGSVAPTLATALGGPYAGMAVKQLASVVLGDSGAKEKDVIKALQGASPEMMAAIKKADQEFEAKMAELGVDLERIAADDRASARDLQRATKGWVVPTLGAITVAGFFGVVGWVLSGQVSLESTLLGFVLGQVSAKAEQVYNFYFGSSAGSKEKTQQLAEKAKL